MTLQQQAEANVRAQFAAQVTATLAYSEDKPKKTEVIIQKAPVNNKVVVDCFVEIVTTSQSIDELNYFPNCDTLQARQPFGNYSVLLYLYFTVIIFLIRLLCVTYRFRTTLTKNKQQFETHGFGYVSQQNIRNQMNHHG